MNKAQELDHVSKNLQVLAASFESTSSFCLKVDINRQQFNKYVSGQHFPSHKVLSKISRYFLMEPEQLSLPPAEFVNFYEGYERSLPVDLHKLPNFMSFIPIAMKSTGDLKKFHGVYCRYHNSSIYKGRILRSIVYIFEKESITQFVTIERFPALDGSGKLGCAFRYSGFCFLVGERLFMMDFEGDKNNEMTFTTLVPQPRTPIKLMHGILNGVAATSYRQPFSTRVIFEHIGHEKLSRKHMRMAAILLPSDMTLPAEVREYITGSNSHIIWGGAD